MPIRTYSTSCICVVLSLFESSPAFVWGFWFYTELLFYIHYLSPGTQSLGM